MDQLTASKNRLLLDAEVVIVATPEGLPVFPTGPDANNVVQFKGDFRGAHIVGFRWDLSVLTTFTAADLTIETSQDGVNWSTLLAFIQKTGVGDESISLLDTDPRPRRFLRGLVDMTGTPGTSTHTLEVLYNQFGPRGDLADGVKGRE